MEFVREFFILVFIALTLIFGSVVYNLLYQSEYSKNEKSTIIFEGTPSKIGARYGTTYNVEYTLNGTLYNKDVDANTVDQLIPGKFSKIEIVDKKSKLITNFKFLKFIYFYTYIACVILLIVLFKKACVNYSNVTLNTVLGEELDIFVYIFMFFAVFIASIISFFSI